jgi:hypothetical protein
VCLARPRLKRSEGLALAVDLALRVTHGKGQSQDPEAGGTTLTVANMG